MVGSGIGTSSTGPLPRVLGTDVPMGHEEKGQRTASPL